MRDPDLDGRDSSNVNLPHDVVIRSRAEIEDAGVGVGVGVDVGVDVDDDKGSDDPSRSFSWRVQCR